MKIRFPHTLLALALTVVAIAVPCGAWFVAGQQQLDREAELERSSLNSHSYKKGVILAERLATRFELLREAESRRPFYHYQNLFHDPNAAAQGESVAISPLAHGSTDPLIDAHFQVDHAGELSLPTLNDHFPELGLPVDESTQCAMQWKLRDVAIFCDIESADGLPEGSRWSSGIEDSVAAATLGQVEKLSRSAWEQHQSANTIYEKLKYKKDSLESELPGEVASGGSPGAADAGLGAGVGSRGAANNDIVEVVVLPFRWHTVPVGGKAALVALRTVDTPAGLWTQGFAIDNEIVEQQLLASSPFPASFSPKPQGGKERERDRVSVAVEGTPWRVMLDVSSDLDNAASKLEEERMAFFSRFVWIAAGAFIAGLLVVLMVFYSERLAQQRAQFAAAAAHELRTPLAGLRLYGEMLAEGLGDPGRARDYARRMAGEAERLGRVVTNVLSFARLERGNLGLSPELGRLQDVVLEAYQRQKMALDEAGAEIELHFDDELPAIAFDRDAVAHIVQNLLDNAERYTRDIPDRRIVLSVQEEAGGVVLSVSDNGRGVSKGLRRRLFRPFARGQETGASEGLGLGLVLVRMLARAQGAEISYRDAALGGADFRVAFPRTPHAA